ncbi:potassium voltage-gated channel subfamily H member 5 [Platysternon megacephalum]|uniref:Potassium voltage-gated channel subfamily H member 5 n=1 Tax=Platysternon megacephalum TaxID=55544 RepID=A0A4D9F6S9_9SAUR|nr:potassium voltage-gated channel subfamily H member 5 [Platysternon megacephalum]
MSHKLPGTGRSLWHRLLADSHCYLNFNKHDADLITCQTMAQILALDVGTKRQLLAISSQLPRCTGQPGLGHAAATGRLAPQQQIHLGFDSVKYFITKVNVGSKDSFWKRHPFM